MAENFYTVVTNTGKAKIANSQVTGVKVDLTQMAVGDGNGAYYNPTETQTALRKEFWRGNIGSIEIDSNNPNWIIIETVIPADAGGFFVREVGLFDTAGDLIAIGKYPETYKPVLTEGSAKDLYIRMIIEVTNASAVTLKIDPAVTIASRKYVNESIAPISQKANENEQMISENQLDTLKRQLENIGYGIQDALDLEVLDSATPDMNIHVQTGVVFMPDGRRFQFNEVTTFALTGADATNARKDIVYVSTTGVITYLAGTAVSTPTEPTLPSGALKLCVIDVPAGDTAIEQAQIIDTRIFKGNLPSLQQEVTEHQADDVAHNISIQVYRLNKDTNGIFTTVEHRRKSDNTLARSSALSGGTSPQYTTKTVNYYAADGSTVIKTDTFTLTYDADGDFISEV